MSESYSTQRAQSSSYSKEASQTNSTHKAAGPSIKPFVFESNQHQRYENGSPVLGLQVCPRTIQVEKNINGYSGYQLKNGDGYIVRMINGDTGCPQMAPKPMRIIKSNPIEVVLRDYMVSAQTPFGYQEVDMGDYGLTVSLEEGKVVKCVLHMYGRNVDIEYRKANNKDVQNMQETSSQTTSTPPSTKSGSINIVELAGQLNFAHNTNNRVAGQLCSMLYNEVGPRRQGGAALLNLSGADCQCVGLAFTATALCYDFGDEDINSVSAENAYYCLARSIIEKGNSFAAPAIFILLQKGTRLMKDKLISSFCSIAQKESGMPSA